MNLLAIVGLAIVLISAGLLLGLTLFKSKSEASFRNIPALTQLEKRIGTSVEDGSRLHFSLGRADLVSPRSAASFVTLSLLRRLAALTSASDNPPVATSGDAALNILAQDTLKSAYISSGRVQQYKASSGQLTGLTPFSYASGALPVMAEGKVSTNVLSGGFGIEVGLLTEIAERNGTFSLAAADSLPAQSVLFASAQEPLIGEELYATGAYVKADKTYTTSLRVQDILRWLLIATMLGGAALKMVGLL